MPQMMPMMWFLMMFYFISCMLMISSFMYFFIYPQIPMIFSKSHSYKNWIWTW